MKKLIYFTFFFVLNVLFVQAQNYAFSFVNKTDIISMGGADVVPPWTVEMWVYKKTTGTSAVLSSSVSKLSLDMSGKVGLTKFGVADWTFPKGYSVPLNTWTHLAWECNGTYTYLFVNGIKTDSLKQVINLPMGVIGRNNESPKALLDEIRMWKVARTVAEINSGMNNKVDSTNVNLVGYWNADNQSFPASDISPMKRTGAITGVTYVTNTNTEFYSGTESQTISSVTSENYNEYLVTPGSKDQDILRINVHVNGGLNPKTISSITVNTNGTKSFSDIAKVKMYYTAGSTIFSTGKAFGIEVSSKGTITFSGSQDLKPGNNYFWVAYDVAQNAVIGNALDAQCVSVTESGGQVSAPVSSASSGMRIIRNAQILSSVDGINIIPKPTSLIVNKGTFNLNASTIIIASDTAAAHEANFLAAYLRKPTGYTLPTSIGVSQPNSLFLCIVNDAALKTEGYRLNVLSDRVVIEANNRIGLFWGFQTLRQLLPAKIEAQSALVGFTWTMPQVNIEDTPVYRHRGSMLDVCRHIFSVEMIKKYIDMLAMYKLNVFHWHLAEDQGWRIESKVFPELNTISSWRNDQCHTSNTRYGGYYTQDEIKEVVRYASERHVEVIPEIEFPGHSVEILAAHPELGCTSGIKPYSVRCEWGVSTDMYCAGKDTTFSFIKKLLDEIVPLFPGKYFHVGADETPFDKWKTCKDCSARIKSLGYSGNPDSLALLKKYFTDRIQSYLLSKGKKTIGWTEITHGGISPGLTVQDWLGGAAVQAARAGNDAIQSIYYQIYLDAAQSGSSSEPASIGYAPNTLDKFYLFNIMPSGLTADEQKHIIGAEAPLWTEMISSDSHLQYMLVPRILALAENTWTVESNKDLNDFKNRLYAHYERFDSLQFNNRKLDLPQVQTIPDSIVSCAVATLSAPSKASSYYWNDPDNTQAATISVTQSGLYKLYYNFFGNIIVKSYNVNIKPTVLKPDISMSVSVDTTFTASGNADNYQWYDAPNGGNLMAMGKSISTSPSVSSKKLWISGSQNMPQYSLNLTGSNYVSCAPLNLTTNGITFEAWVKATGTQNDVAGIIFSRGTSAFGLNVRSNGQLMYHWNDNYYNWNSGLTLPDNTWVHVALVITPSSATIYLNDKSATNTASHVAATLSAPLNIGYDTSNRYFKGSIDEVRVWNTALTKDQIVKNMYLQMNGTESGLRACFNMNEGKETTTTDLVTGIKANIINPSGTDWQCNNPCPVINKGCESERWLVNSTVSGVKSINNNHFIIYPNPNDGRFTIVMNMESADLKKIVWYDLAGKRVNFSPKTKESTFNQLKIAYQGIPKGMYIVDIMNENGIKQVEKVVVE